MIGTIIRSVTVSEKKLPGLALDIYIKHVYMCCCCFRIKVMETRQLAVTKLFDLLKISTEDSGK